MFAGSPVTHLTATSRNQILSGKGWLIWFDDSGWENGWKVDRRDTRADTYTLNAVKLEASRGKLSRRLHSMLSRDFFYRCMRFSAIADTSDQESTE